MRGTKLLRLLWPLALGLLAACNGGPPPPDFTISLNPTSLTVQQGGSGTTQLTLTPQNGFTGMVALTLEQQDGTAAPSGITLSPASVTVSGSSPVTQALTLSVGGSVATGTYNLRVKATSGSLVKTANITVTVDVQPVIRIVLTWVSSIDLDAHLTGPLPDGTRFHVYWNNDSVLPYAELDQDSSDGGPETITIYQRISGVYRYSVHHFFGSSSSYQLSNSGAQVRVYRGNDLVATFNVPPNQPGNLWTVFEMSGDTITPVNTISYVSSASAVP